MEIFNHIPIKLRYPLYSHSHLTGCMCHKSNLQALFGLFLMNAENFAKMSAPTSKDSLFVGLRWGYLQVGAERSASSSVNRPQKSHRICGIMKHDDTWEGPVFVRETLRFWWSLFWGCRCRGGKEGWSRGPGLWARPASWRWHRTVNKGTLVCTPRLTRSSETLAVETVKIKYCTLD